MNCLNQGIASKFVYFWDSVVSNIFDLLGTYTCSLMDSYLMIEFSTQSLITFCFYQNSQKK